MALSAIPATMAAVVINKTGGTDVLEYKTDVPVPQLKAGEILVKNEYIGINFIDTYFRTGLYKAPSFPYTLGREASGIIAAVADSGEFYGMKVGDHVAFSGEASYASYTAILAAKAVKVPEAISLAEAAAGPIQAMTAWTLLHESHAVKPGDWILVTAAAGGVGQWLVQMAKYLGVKVIATCSTSKMELARKLGADHVIDYSKDDYVKPVMDITGGAGVAAVFDSVGKSTFDSSLECVARKGTMVSFGNASGAVEPFSILRLSAKNVKLVRPTLFQYLATREELEANANAVFDFMQKDGVKVDIYKIYPLADAGKAQEDLESRKTTGKLLLKP